MSDPFASPLQGSFQTSDQRVPEDIPSAAYVHIPFCRQRCHYCDFPIAVLRDEHTHPIRDATIGSTAPSPVPPPQSDKATRVSPDPILEPRARYVTALCREIKTTPPLGQQLNTVFFGGGTPSLLSVAQLTRILTRLDHHFGIATTAEISIEMDPGTFDLAQLQGYRAAGINRVSLGAQVFQDELLQACGRSHTLTDIHQAVETIHQAGLTNFSLDLIAGLPHQTLAQWQTTLETAIALNPPHISVYDLTIEPGTAFGHWYEPGVSPLPADNLTADMYRQTQRLLTAAGYDHYEISNYARPGYRCRHNQTYWHNQPYYGFGMGATSYTQQQRFARPRHLSSYYPWVEQFVHAKGSYSCAPTPPREQLLDQLMLGLRLAQGLRLGELVNQWGEPLVNQVLACLSPYQQQGWVDLHPTGSISPGANPLDDLYPLTNKALRLTDPEGFLFSNVVLVALFEALELDGN